MGGRLKTQFKKNNDTAGFTIVGGLVLLVVVIFSGVTISRLFTSQKMLMAGLDKKEKAIEIVNGTVRKMNRIDFNALVALCRKYQKMDLERPSSGDCIKSQEFNTSPSGSTDTIQNPFQFEVVRDVSGANNAQGDICVELAQCKSLGNGQVLDISLNVVFKLGEAAQSRLITFRRARW